MVSGPDGYTPEFYKRVGAVLLPYLQEVFTSCQLENKLPPSWAVARLILLLKQDCDLSKPISLLNVDYTFFTTILATSLNGILGNYVHQDQLGFIKNHQSRDNT